MRQRRKHLAFFQYQIHGLTVICLLLLVGAVGKSAHGQIGLHTWLPDAMEGPSNIHRERLNTFTPDSENIDVD
jgi:NADH:ubiquinone oxidoreductase subunit 5 (subunit L)/multisubunit Na+/H+ antiporter MnhA subunit